MRAILRIIGENAVRVAREMASPPDAVTF